MAAPPPTSRLRNAGQPDDRLFRLYVALFLLDLTSEHGQRFNGNEPVSSPEALPASRRRSKAPSRTSER